MRWEHKNGFESFMMIERITSDITAQYAKMGAKYICKNVVISDPATHITMSDFECVAH